jgi:general secretion pathway protein K
MRSLPKHKVGVLRRIHDPSRSDEQREEGRKGMALILALVMVALVTAFIAEFNYSARVKILSASHARDDAKAYYLAKGGLRMYELLLIIGRSSASNPMFSQMLATLGMSVDGAAMVCRSIPFLDTAMLRFLAGAGGSISEDEEEGLMGVLGFGGDDPDRGKFDNTEAGQGQEGLRRDLLAFEGDFKIDCSDESSKIDLNGFASAHRMALPLQNHPTAAMLYGLMVPPEYDPLFEERLKMDRWELIGNIRDWVDADSQRTGNFGGDEDGLYDDFEPRYHSKNAKFDSLEELRLVAGVNDEVFTTFSPAISVHTDNIKINVNAANPTTIRALIAAYADPLLVTWFQIDQAMPALMFGLKFMPGPARNPNDFVNRVKAQGIALRPELEATFRDSITTDSKAFRLSATGYVGDSARTITETVRVGRVATKVLEWKER